MKFRVARHTNNLKAISDFYCSILHFEILGSFQDHESYDGVFLGKNGLDWHLEFTKSNQSANHQFDDDDLLVFYPDTKEEFDQITKSIKKNEIKILPAKNPYWNKNGILIEDPDGYKVVICL